MLLGGAVAREHDLERLPAHDGAKHREKRLADRTGRREEEEERAPARTTDRDRAAAEVRRRHDRRHLPDRRPADGHEGADRRDAFVEDADLTGERDDHAGEHEHEDPEDDVRDEERLGHASSRRAARRSTAA